MNVSSIMDAEEEPEDTDGGTSQHTPPGHGLSESGLSMPDSPIGAASRAGNEVNVFLLYFAGFMSMSRHH